MARSGGKLKVYRAAMGFHDVYVAAPSQKAALEAWGSDHDLFARGIAEVVTEPALTEQPLAQPGIVVKRLRGSAAEQIAALPDDAPKPGKATKSPRAGARPKRRSTPPPSRSEIDEAERALADAEARHCAQADELARKEAQLQRDRRNMEKAHAAETARLRRSLDRVGAAYEKAVRKWRG